VLAHNDTCPLCRSLAVLSSVYAEAMELVIQKPFKKQAIKKRPKALFQLDT
jgi:hypothetical protein